ncbi:MAG: hypothetical protein ACETWE_05410 [Candidatus Bathyarchaeia archaeon]
MAGLVLILLLGTVSASVSEEYTYYGVVPGRIHYAVPKHYTFGSLIRGGAFEIDPPTVAGSALVSIVALQDDTEVEVHTLEDNRLVAEATLNTMEKEFVRLQNGTRFKVVSNHLVTVMLLGGNVGGEELDPSMREGPTPATFYTSTDGTYVGKEFIFVASQGLTGFPYRILALEDAEVTITREDGDEDSFTLQANTYESLSLTAFKAYKVESTGNIMIQSDGPGGRSFNVPSPEGGFVGKVFYSTCLRDSFTAWDTIEDFGFRISSMEDSRVTVWDVEFKRTIGEFEIKGGEGVGFKPKADEIMIEGDKPIVFSFVHNGSLRRSFGWGYGAGVTYMGVKPNEETPIYFSSNSSVEAYIFAYEDTLVKIDDVSMNLKPDSFFLLTVPGTHKIMSDKNVVIQVIHWPLTPPIQGIASFGVVMPCIQTTNLTPDVSLTPMVTEGFNMTYITIGIAAAAVVAAAAVFIVMKRRTR